MKKHLIAFVAAAMCASPTGGAGAKAQGLIEVQEIVEACRADYFRLCPGVRPGGGRILECLSTYQRQLSTPCRDALAIAIAVRSCRFDYNRFCRDVDPGSGRVLSCLRAHERDLSYECRDAISERGGRGGYSGPRSELAPEPHGRWRRAGRGDGSGHDSRGPDR